MMEEKYEPWRPIEELPNSPFFYEMYFKEGKLIVLLKESDLDNRCLKIEFTNPLAYRIVNESARMKTLNNPFIYTFCKTNASDFLEWFNQESYGMFSELDENHYMICNSDNIIDVITNQIPEVFWTDQLE
ncbi:hypothetical protein D3C87_1272290 [compost metagenome]|jgi:hypothetical protein|uniref:hypothetical protein n=1 Tax=Sphingobacterium faecium TaxID=34087 RepID=UPI0004E601BE|nr:hypothetical protein [Sphingobacterium faecium]MQP29955.1 hypothetical protein [Sphingobacterium faecium]WGQ14309.1 hypothetical protein QG727_20065 [Sphingobacterium faecium]CDT29269.1 conserved hypothetical protein [Sphingobacterium sp. PM2-P1-29]